MRAILYRAGVASLAGLIVFSILYISAWITCGDARNVCRRQSDTQSTLRWISRKIEETRKVTGSLPDSLNDIGELRKELTVDEWNNEIRYVPADDATYKLYSLGRDGEIGGIGL